MRTRLFIAAAAFGMLSAGAQTTINGSVKDTDFEGKTIYLTTYEGRTANTLDSAVVTGGKFQFKGTYTTPRVAVMGFSSPGSSAYIILEQGDYSVELSGKRRMQVRTAGTPTQDAFNDYQLLRQKYRNIQDSLARAYQQTSDSVRKEELTNEFMQSREDLQKESGDLADKNANNYCGTYLMANVYNDLPVDRVKAFLANVPEALQSTHTYQDIKANIEAKEKTMPGKPYVDIKLSDPDGKAISLSDYVGKGKYVLVDFWATWCGPCMQELPNVVETYKQYKDKGLEIVGVSLDSKGDSWRQVIKEKNMVWPQMSDLKGWSSDAAKAYNIRYIPATILIDPSGKIVERDLRGEQLLKRMSELLDKK